MYLAIALYVALSGTLFYKERRASSNQLLLVLISLPSIGLALLCDEFGYLPLSTLIVCSPAFVVVGILIGESKRSRKTSAAETPPDNRFLWAASFIVGALSLYHLTQVGIALFSANVEVDRFNLGASGLFGLPSRSVLFGLPALALYTIVSYSEDKKRITVFNWVLFAITQFSLGFKGALFTLISTLVLGLLLQGRLRGAKLAILSAVGIAASTMYALSVASRYGTISTGNLNIQLIIDRITLETARPQYLALRMQETLSGLTGSALWHDIPIFLEKYLTGFTPRLTVESIVSATLTGTPPSREYFIVQVTIGGPIYLLLTGGILLTVSILVILGFLWSKGSAMIRNPSSHFVGVQLALFLETLSVFLTNGNGAYLLINTGFISIVFSGIYFWFRIIKRNEPERISRNQPPKNERNHARTL
jgi:hypothetical protein